MVERTRRGCVAHGRAHTAATDHPLESLFLHQPRHRAAGDVVPFAAQLTPDLAHAVDLEVLIEDPPDLDAEHDVALDARRRCLRIGAAGDVGVVRRRGDRQHLADRLDPVIVAIRIDEADHGFHRRSSSAWAKYALALRRISLACRSSRFSRSSAFRRSRSSRRNTGLATAVDARPVFTQLLQRLRRAADLGRDRHDRCPLRGVLAAVLQHHPHGAFAHLGGKLRGCPVIRHGSILSRVGASDKPGAVQTPEEHALRSLDSVLSPGDLIAACLPDDCDAHIVEHD